MRLVIDARVLSERAQGGITYYTRELLRHLTPYFEHDEVVWYSSGLRQRVSSESSVSVKHLRIPNKLLGISSVSFGVPRIDRLVGGADVVFLPNLHFANVSSSCKLIMTVHDLSFRHFPSMYSFRGRLWHALVRPSRLLARADAVIAPSEATKRDLIESAEIPADRIHVIPPGLTRSPYEELSDAAAARARRSLGVTQKYILGIGGFDERKNLSVVVEAYRRMPESIRHEYDMVLIGQTLWREHRSERSRMLSTPGVKFLGYVEDREKIALLKGAAAVVYPSLYEGFGFPVLEGFAAGSPVVTSSVTSLPEVAGDAALLADPLRPDSVADALKHIVTDRSLARALTNAGKERVKEFSWERTAAATHELITRISRQKPIAIHT